ncbi:MAG: hypothetical protein WBO10_11150 [Pyrinomonadaceae bacterium]
MDWGVFDLTVEEDDSALVSAFAGADGDPFFITGRQMCSGMTSPPDR